MVCQHAVKNSYIPSVRLKLFKHVLVAKPVSYFGGYRVHKLYSFTWQEIEVTSYATLYVLYFFWKVVFRFLSGNQTSLENLEDLFSRIEYQPGNNSTSEDPRPIMS